MKYTFVLILLVSYISHSFAVSNQEVSAATNIDEEKIIELFVQYYECMQQSEIEKDRLTSTYYKYKKQQCARPLAELLLKVAKNTEQINE